MRVALVLLLAALPADEAADRPEGVAPVELETEAEKKQDALDDAALAGAKAVAEKTWLNPFIPVEVLNDAQLLLLTCVYGYVLFEASNLISDGSELLLLVPAWADLIGSVVLPVLGAVPDGLMVLFSGLGKNAGSTIAVGVGALAGSTIMLLTIPWFLALAGGRVDIVNFEPQYRRPRYAPDSWCKLTPENRGNWYSSGSKTGVGVGAQISQNAVVMMSTSLLFFCMQLPDLYYSDLTPEERGEKEVAYAIFGFIACIIAFCLYLYAQFKEAFGDVGSSIIDEKRIDAIKHGDLSLRGAMMGLMQDYIAKGELSPDTPLLEISETHPLRRALSNVLIRFFAYYDINRDHKIDLDELRCIMSDLHEEANQEEIQSLFNKSDVDHSGFIEYSEFVTLMLDFLQRHLKEGKMDKDDSKPSAPRTLCLINEDEEDEEGDEEEDIPEDLQDLSPEQQQVRIRYRAFKLMIMGTVLVTGASDPMVDCLAEWGNRLGVSPFYVAFVLAPMASNASELTAAYNYALKKTQKSMTISLCALEGAACMNNTFCLAIFFLVMWINKLPWKFTAETIVIVGVQMVMGLVATKRVMRFRSAFMVLALYPLSLMLVYILENWYGLD